MVAQTQVDPTSKVARDRDDKRTIRDKDDKRTIRDKDDKRTIRDKDDKRTIRDKDDKRTIRDKDDKRTIRDKDDKRTIRDKDGKRTIKDKTHVTADETTADKVITTSKTRTSALRIRVLDFLPENLILLLLFQLPSSQNLCPISPDRNSARHT